VAQLGYLARGDKNIFALLPTKTAEIEVKNRCKGAEEAKEKHLLFVTSVIFRSSIIQFVGSGRED